MNGWVDDGWLDTDGYMSGSMMIGWVEGQRYKRGMGRQMDGCGRGRRMGRWDEGVVGEWVG